MTLDPHDTPPPPPEPAVEPGLCDRLKPFITTLNGSIAWNMIMQQVGIFESRRLAVEARVVALEAEIERLRSALCDIASHVTDEWTQDFFDHCSSAEEIAARALLASPPAQASPYGSVLDAQDQERHHD